MIEDEINTPLNDGNTESEEIPISSSKIAQPMSWIAGGATIINLVLGTGPFSYPQIFAGSGIIFAPLLMFFVMLVAF